MIFLKTSPFLGFLALLIHQPIAATLSLQQRDGESLPLHKRQGGKTYWLHPSCNTLGGGQFRQSIKEAIWVASRIPEKLNAFDGQLADPETFRRIGDITEIQDRKQAHIRILCNEDDDYQPVDAQGRPIPRPAGASEIRQTKYYNKEDESYLMGGGSLCRVMVDVEAITYPVESNNNQLNLPPAPGQEPERHVIKFCNLWSNSMAINQLPFTVRDFSTFQLDQGSELWRVGSLPIVTLIHEFSHINFLSKQDFTVPSANPAGAGIRIQVIKAKDSHHLGTTISGYFMDQPGRRQLMGSRGLSWRETIMNADSYGYFALIFRLREKQWEAYTTGQGSQEIIRFAKNLQLPDRGDGWPQ